MGFTRTDKAPDIPSILSVGALVYTKYIPVYTIPVVYTSIWVAQFDWGPKPGHRPGPKSANYQDTVHGGPACVVGHWVATILDWLGSRVENS